MESFSVLAQIGGAVALLLFGLRLVRDGMTEAFGLRLKMALGFGTRTRPRAFVSGLVATLGLQSSTATALMTASFVESEMILPGMAQIVLLGANVGTALTAWIVSAGVEAVSPFLILAGFILRRPSRPTASGVGLALIGIGLMLLSLTLLSGASAPIRDSRAVAAFLGLLDGAWPVAFVVAALLAVLCSSSLAVVMLLLSLSLAGGLTPALSVVMVLGANFGGAIPPILATLGSSPAARRVTLGNLAVRGIGCLVAAPFAGHASEALALLPSAADSLPVEAHLAFNLILAAVIWPFTMLISKFVGQLIPDATEDEDMSARWLDDSALETPAIALAGASREALVIGDLVEKMMILTIQAFRKNDPTPLHEVAALENRVDRLQHEVKIYLSRLGRDAAEADKRRAIIILDYVINLEHSGDIIEKGLSAEVDKKISHGLRFSDEGYRELNALFLLTQDNMRTAQTIFISRDKNLARKLVQIKVDIRRMERESAERHFLRLQDGQDESLHTSSLHLDMLRDLKRVNAHIVSVAYPVLDEDGLLIESRLKASTGS
ncbi:MAG: Na/Pi cotransporter family protein [Paracoccaceae bacterium]